MKVEVPIYSQLNKWYIFTDHQGHIVLLCKRGHGGVLYVCVKCILMSLDSSLGGIVKYCITYSVPRLDRFHPS